MVRRLLLSCMSFNGHCVLGSENARRAQCEERLRTKFLPVEMDSGLQNTCGFPGSVTTASCARACVHVHHPRNVRALARHTRCSSENVCRTGVASPS